MTELYDYNSDNKTISKCELRSPMGDCRKNDIIMSRGLFYAIFRNKTYKLFSDISVPKNSKLYFAQPVPVAMNEIRRNYSIARNPEVADYIIFAPQKWPKATFCTYYSEYYKDSNILFAGNGYEGVQRVKWGSTVPQNEEAITGSVVIYSVRDANSAYRNLLSGKFKKPCVTCDKLDLSATNKVTLDSLNIVIASAGTSRYYTDAQIAELQTKLTMLGQYDWRSIPCTMSVLRELLYNTGCGYRIMNNLSRNNKTVNAVVKEVLQYTNTCEYDLSLGRQLLASVFEVDLTTPAFVSLESLLEKCISKGLSYQHIIKFFNCTVRLTDKTIN